jgi:hypothetical protein
VHDVSCNGASNSELLHKSLLQSLLLVSQQSHNFVEFFENQLKHDAKKRNVLAGSVIVE